MYVICIFDITMFSTCSHILCVTQKKKNGSKMSQCKDIENRILNHSSTIGKWRKNWPTISSRKIFTNVQESRRNTSIRHLSLTLYGLTRNAADMFLSGQEFMQDPDFSRETSVTVHDPRACDRAQSFDDAPSKRDRDMQIALCLLTAEDRKKHLRRTFYSLHWIS